MAKSTEKRAILRGDGNSRSVVQQDGSNSVQSVLNLVKVCIGTGALALPFAVNEGGLLFGTLGLLFMAAWNQYASYRLDMLRNWTGATTYASLAEVVLGPWARVLVDVCTISTLLGVCVVYTITFATLVHATPLALAPGHISIWRETVVCGALVLPLSCSPHMKFLANTSAIGLLALVAGFAAIIFYGLQEFGWMGLGWTSSEEGGVGEEDHLGEGSGSGFTSGSPFASASASGSVAEEQEEEVVCAQVNLFPLSLDHFSNWFGVAAFCYGVPPLQFSLQDAMESPQQFTTYSAYALGLVFVLYTVGGTGIAWLYRCDAQGIQENVLSNLPEGAFATTVRLCYAVVCVTSFPLCLVPVADMAKPLLVQATVSLSRSWDDFTDLTCRACCTRGTRSQPYSAPPDSSGSGSGGGGLYPTATNPSPFSSSSSSSSSSSTSTSSSSRNQSRVRSGGGASADVLSGECFRDIFDDGSSNNRRGGGGSEDEEGGSMCGLPSSSIIPLRVAVVISTTCTALLFPDFGLIVAIIGSFSVTLTSFVLPSLMCLACAADSSGLTQAGHRPWMTTPSPTHQPAASPNRSSNSSSSGLSASGNGDGVGQYGVGGSYELSALVLPPRADSFSPTSHGATSTTTNSFDSSSAIDQHHHQRLTTNSSFGLLGQQELESSVVGNTPCRPPGREVNGFGAHASPLWWWVDLTALGLGLLTCALTTSLTLVASAPATASNIGP